MKAKMNFCCMAYALKNTATEDLFLTSVNFSMG